MLWKFFLEGDVPDLRPLGGLAFLTTFCLWSVRITVFCPLSSMIRWWVILALYILLLKASSPSFSKVTSTMALLCPFWMNPCSLVHLFKHLPQPLRSHIRSFGTLGQLLKFSKKTLKNLKMPPPQGDRGVPEFFWGLISPFFVRINPM